MASQNMEKLESNVAIIDYSQDVPLSTSYEVAMEALSSLIRQKKRGDRKGIGGKYGKLDRMRIYLKVTILLFFQLFAEAQVFMWSRACEPAIFLFCVQVNMTAHFHFLLDQ